METRRIAITGASGFLGANLTHYFLESGHEIYPIIRTTSNTWRINDIINEINVTKLKDSSGTEFKDIFEKLKPEVIINAMGVDQKKAASNNSLYWKSNFLSIVNLVEGIRGLSTTILIHAGSSFEYGKATLKQNPVSEDATCEPISDYAISKFLSTEYLRYVTQKLSHTISIFRIFNLYGPYDSSYSLITDITLKSILGEEIVLKNPFAIRDFIHVKDAIEAVRIAMVNHTNDTGLSIMNLGTGVGTKVSDIASLVNKLNGEKSQIKVFPGDQRPENSIPGPIADMTKTFNFLNWKPKVNIEKGLYEQNDWIKNHRDLYKN